MLVVEDLARSIAFYRDVLGAEVQREYGASSAILSFLGASLLLVTEAAPSADKPAVTFAPPHDPARTSQALSLRVPDCHAAYETLLARGGEFLAPPVEYSWEIRTWLRDPDGHLIEITEPRG